MEFVAASAPDLTRCLRAALASEPDSWGEDKLHASDLQYGIDGEGCARQLKLRLTGAEKRADHDGERWMYFHGHRLQREAFDLIRPQLESLYPGWQLVMWEHSLAGYIPGIESGRIDSALVNFPECVALPVDCKTRRGKAFDYLTGDVKPANAIQVRAYCIGLDEWLNRDERAPRWNVPGGVLLVLDREGQNFARQQYVERDDAEVYLAAQRLQRIKSMRRLPAVLSPVVARRVNKGPDSLTLKMPWNCDWCAYLGVSCPGALPPDLRDLGIVGKDMDGSFVPAKGLPEGVEEIVRALLPKPPEVDLEEALRASLAEVGADA